jgi:hypothetical protein
MPNNAWMIHVNFHFVLYSFTGLVPWFFFCVEYVNRILILSVESRANRTPPFFSYHWQAPRITSQTFWSKREMTLIAGQECLCWKSPKKVSNPEAFQFWNEFVSKIISSVVIYPCGTYVIFVKWCATKASVISIFNQLTRGHWRSLGVRLANFWTKISMMLLENWEVVETCTRALRLKANKFDNSVE